MAGVDICLPIKLTGLITIYIRQKSEVGLKNEVKKVTIYRNPNTLIVQFTNILP